jgi:DMSO/TMAO reductase YedYZ molybdopterin-dependent catalytic subunit
MRTRHAGCFRMRRMNRVVITAEPPNEETSADGLTSPSTPTDAHYVRCHFRPPIIDARSHRIRVDGAVVSSRAVTIDDLRRLGERSVTMTMECAGNGRLSMTPLPAGEPFDDGALSTATWTGTPLRALLDEVGLCRNVVEVLAQGADSGTPHGGHETIPYARSLPLEAALNVDTLLAWGLNGEALPVEHGGPIRLVVPDWYGMASVKWLSYLRALEVPFEGWFQTHQYVYVLPNGASTPVTTMRVKSHVITPSRGARMKPGIVRVSGWAWSGHGRIAGVEVALDGDGPWIEANVEPQESPHAWARFDVDLDVTTSGRHTVRSRATDTAGNVQPEVVEWNSLGYGNNAVLPIVFSMESRERVRTE